MLPEMLIEDDGENNPIKTSFVFFEKDKVR